MHACCERRRSNNPTLWVVTTTGDQGCRTPHRTSTCERKSGLRALLAHAYTRPHRLSLPNWEVALLGDAPTGTSHLAGAWCRGGHRGGCGGQIPPGFGVCLSLGQ